MNLSHLWHSSTKSSPQIVAILWKCSRLLWIILSTCYNWRERKLSHMYLLFKERAIWKSVQYQTSIRLIFRWKLHHIAFRWKPPSWCHRQSRKSMTDGMVNGLTWFQLWYWLVTSNYRRQVRWSRECHRIWRKGHWATRIYHSSFKFWK